MSFFYYRLRCPLQHDASNGEYIDVITDRECQVYVLFCQQHTRHDNSCHPVFTHNLYTLYFIFTRFSIQSNDG